jgi:hypothetical protein
MLIMAFLVWCGKPENKSMRMCNFNIAVNEYFCSSPGVKSTKPAYERFTSLDDPTPPGLTLPKHYKLLQDQFNSTDTVVSILHKRAEICTFSKIKPAVQQMTSK